MPKTLRIGIVCESASDLEVVHQFLKKILEPEGLLYSFIDPITPQTGILGYVRPATRALFETGNADVGIFLTDQDKETEDRRKRVKEEIKKVQAGYVDYSAVGVCDPHFEKWIIADENTVKRIFNLQGSAPIPFADLTPKQRVKALYKTLTPPQPSLHDIYLQLCSESDLTIIRKFCPDFQLFQDEVIDVCRFVLSL